MRQCEICKKGSRMGGARKLLRGHYNPTNWSRKYPNIQWAKIDGIRKRVCTDCMRGITKKAATQAKAVPKKAIAAKTA